MHQRNFWIFVILLLSACLAGTPFDTLGQSKSPELRTVDQSAQYPGGGKALARFLSENLEYPESAKAFAIKGNVIARFAVTEEGQIANIQIVRGLSADCDDEVRRVIEMMPDWKPAIMDGAPVATLIMIPIRFELEYSF